MLTTCYAYYVTSPLYIASFLPYVVIVSLSIFNIIVDSGILPYLAYAYFIRYILRGIPPTPIYYYPILIYGVYS
jgi:hypothetical protein